MAVRARTHHCTRVAFRVFTWYGLKTLMGTERKPFLSCALGNRLHAMLVLATSTWNAYNTWGGDSYYTGGHITSPVRPLQAGFLSKPDPHLYRIARYKDWGPEQVQAYRETGCDSWSMAAGWANWGAAIRALG